MNTIIESSHDESHFNNEIIEISQIIWNKIKNNYHSQYINLIIPIHNITEIDSINTISCHLEFQRYKKLIHGRFIIRNRNKNYYFCDNHINEKNVNSEYTNKELYFYCTFFREKLKMSDLNNTKNELFKNFLSKINILFFDYIKKLKFDNYFGKFVIGSSLLNDNTKLFHSFSNILQNFDNVNLIGDKCSVCHEQTLTKTLCNHHLCIRCYSKISLTNGIESKCPLCRAHI